MAQGTRRFLRNAVDNVFGNGADSQSYIKGTGKWMADSAEGRSINNLWTGKALGKKGRIATSASIVGGLGVYSLVAPGAQIDKEIQAAAREDNIQSLPTSQADGVGYTAFPSVNMMDYAPSGDLVFALHKNRHG